jgi:hypothetical protein
MEPARFTAQILTKTRKLPKNALNRAILADTVIDETLTRAYAGHRAGVPAQVTIQEKQ